jgi:hypothetical protein
MRTIVVYISILYTHMYIHIWILLIMLRNESLYIHAMENPDMTPLYVDVFNMHAYICTVRY